MLQTYSYNELYVKPTSTDNRLINLLTSCSTARQHAEAECHADATADKAS